MMTGVEAPESVIAQPRRRAVTRDRFFAAMSGVTLLIVFSGFAPSLYLRPIFQPEPIPPYLYVHGIVLTSWFVLLFIQGLLIQSGRPALHRRLGVVGAVLAVVIPFAGLMATVGVVPRLVASGVALDSDASALGIGAHGPVVAFMATVVWGNVNNAVSFAVLAWAGLALRRRPAAHKRLMLLATISILGPALARIARFPFLGGEQGPFILTAMVTLLFAVVVHDLITIRRLHPATLFGVAFVITANQITLAFQTTDSALALVRWLQ